MPCAAVAADGTVGPVELAVFHAINGLPEALSPAMRWVQWLGVLAIGPIVAAVAALTRRWRLAVACLLVTGEKLLAERIVWELLERSRPGKTIGDAIVQGDTPMAGRRSSRVTSSCSRGSPGSSRPTSGAPGGAVAWAVVALVALARVYLGSHAPLDVLGGFGLGLVVGGTANVIVGLRPRVAGVADHGRARYN